MEGFTPDQLMAVALASPAAVARHDGDGWVALFSRHGIIEDPVGSTPRHGGLHDRRSGVRGSGPLRRFFDTFIAPNEITFHVDADVVADPLVVRDLTIELSMAGGPTVRVPMHVTYEITAEDGELKIAHLRAHWELIPMVRQVLQSGWPGVTTMNRLGLRMIANDGIGAALGFARGVLGVHGAGKTTVERFVSAVNERDPHLLATIFSPGHRGIGVTGRPDTIDLSAFCKDFNATLSVSKVISSGYVTSASCVIHSGDQEARGVGFFEFNSRTRRLHSVRLHCA